MWIIDCWKLKIAESIYVRAISINNARLTDLKKKFSSCGWRFVPIKKRRQVFFGCPRRVLRFLSSRIHWRSIQKTSRSRTTNAFQSWRWWKANRQGWNCNLCGMRVWIKRIKFKWARDLWSWTRKNQKDLFWDWAKSLLEASADCQRVRPQCVGESRFEQWIGDWSRWAALCFGTHFSRNRGKIRDQLFNAVGFAETNEGVKKIWVNGNNEHFY